MTAKSSFSARFRWGLWGALGLFTLLLGIFLKETRPQLEDRSRDPYLHQPWSGPTLDSPIFQPNAPQVQAYPFLVIDYIRKDYSPSNRLETSVFVHYQEKEENPAASRPLFFIQIYNVNHTGWHIDENPDHSRKAMSTGFHRGPFPYFPRQYLEPHGINLYDRPGHGPDPAPELRWGLNLSFPFNHYALVRTSLNKTFQQDFESCAVEVIHHTYHFLGSVKWGHSFAEGKRASDYYGPLHQPQANQGTSGSLALLPPSPDFLAVMRLEAPPLAP